MTPLANYHTKQLISNVEIPYSEKILAQGGTSL